MRFQTISNSIAHDNVSTVPAIIKDLYGLQRGLQGISNSIAHDNASTVSATIIDSYGPGVGNAYFFQRFQIASAATMQAPCRLLSQIRWS